MFRYDDIEKIKSNINSIKDRAAEEYRTLYEPTLKEISDIYKVIKDYIIKKKRVVYGGYAQNLLLKIKSPELVFYREINGACYNWPDIADIEYYTDEPLKDVVYLTEELYSKGFKYVESKEAAHEGTYKIFVNFENYCDITYIPTNVYDNLPIMNIENMICVHPHFMMVDAYKILTDPMTSYWRIDRAINRFNKLIENYPIDESLTENKLKFPWNNNNIDTNAIKFIREKIIKKSNLIVVGFYAYDYYTKKQNTHDMLKSYPYYDIISTTLSEDAHKIYNTLCRHYDKKNIKVKEYNQFYIFLDKKIEYYYKDNLILVLHGNNNRCIVHNFSLKKLTYFGTFNLVLLYLLFNYYYYYVNRDKKHVDFYEVLISKLFYNRNKYLTRHKITVIDKSPFQDFTLKCMGFPVDQRRQSFLEGFKKKSLGRKIRFQYTPTGKIKEPPTITFTQLSGNQIFLEKNLILKNI